MVVTRSQSRRSNGGGRHARQHRSRSIETVDDESVNGSSSSGSSSSSSSGGRHAGRGNATPKKGTPVNNPARSRAIELLQLEAPRGNTPIIAGGAAVAAPVEQLGRGCRVSRLTVTLDDEYLATLHYGVKSGGGNPGRRGGGGGGGGVARRGQPQEEEEEFIINERYPPRPAAQRALSSMRDALNGKDDDEEEEEEVNKDKDSSSSSSGTDDDSDAPSEKFNYRHHPEMDRKKKTKKKSGRRYSDNTSSSDRSSSSSSSSGSEHGGGSNTRARKSDGHNTRSSNRNAHTNGSGRPTPTPTTTTTTTAVSTAATAASAHTAATAASRSRRAASVDSSISADSMREPSVEELARRDAAEHRLSNAVAGGGGSGSDTDSADETGGLVTEQDMRRARRNAKEAVTKNININYYMKDAIGQEDDRAARRRKVDRRYRHLFALDEEEKEQQQQQQQQGSGGTGTDTTTTAGAAGALGDISPLKVDADITFDSVGGLPGHIVALREMVLLPLLYPQLLKAMNLTPPRGVLFVGPPGTGKTLVARALAVEGSRCSEKKVTFFMRKGADILSKWVGESERQLKLLFEEARRHEPSIIFFDEIDGLAPTRHTKTEQSQAALVATLLALLDGLDDRGQVVVIGATNRPDTIDPALRRPGRFDRELTFPLPDAAARRHILSIVTAKQNIAPMNSSSGGGGSRVPSGSSDGFPSSPLPSASEDKAAMIDDLVTHTEGYSGADLKALCTEAGLNRLRTALPQLYTTSQKLVLPANLTSSSSSSSSLSLAIRREDFFAAARRLNPSMRRGGQEMHLGQMEEHLEKLFHSCRESLLHSVAATYTTVARALAKERRDCSDIQSAVRHLSSFPIPYSRHALMLFLTVCGGDGGEVSSRRRGSCSGGSKLLSLPPPPPPASANKKSKSKSNSSARPSTTTVDAVAAINHSNSISNSISNTADAAARQLVLMNTCVAMIRGLPSFQTMMVHLPHVCVTFAGGADSAMVAATGGGGGIHGEGAVGSPYAAGGFTGGHMYQLVQAVQRCSPCVVLLRGAEEWLRDQGLPLPNNDNNTTNADDDEEDGNVGGDGENPHGFSQEEFSERSSRMEALRYYLGLLADTEAILMVPCASDATRRAMLGERLENTATAAPPPPPMTHTTNTGDGCAETRLIPSTRHRLHPHFAILSAAVRPTPPAADLAGFVAHLHRTIALAFRVQFVMAVRAPGSGTNTSSSGQPTMMLEVDRSPPKRPLLSRGQRRERHLEAVALWRRVEYRRLQLRHVLLKWVAGFVTQGRFKLLLSGTLNLVPVTPLYKQWKRHTKGSRIGLDDILEKLEAERYTCLSQFHDDIDALVRNVRGFFRTRAPADQRYRVKALELKETALLNMYKINRGVVRFCEAHRDLVEPPPLSSLDRSSSSSSDDDDDVGGVERRGPRKRDRQETDTSEGEEEGDDAAARALRFNKGPAVPKRSARKFRLFGQRKRRPARAKKPAPKPLPGSDEEEEAAEKVGSGADDGGEEAKATSAPPSGNEGGGGGGGSGPGSKQNGSAEEEEEGADGALAASPFGSPRSPINPPDAEVEAWAVALLRGLAYHELHKVFQFVMQDLDAEVRRRDGGGGGADSDGGVHGKHNNSAGGLGEDGESPRPKLVSTTAKSISSSRSRSSDGGSGRGSGDHAKDGTAAAAAGADATEEPLERPEMFFARTLSVAVGKVRLQRRRG